MLLVQTRVSYVSRSRSARGYKLDDAEVAVINTSLTEAKNKTNRGSEMVAEL